MSTRAADDFAEIRRNRIRLTRICYRKLDLPLSECWCLKAGPDGEDIPCSEARDPTPWERVELGKPDAQSSELKIGQVVGYTNSTAIPNGSQLYLSNDPKAGESGDPVPIWLIRIAAMLPARGPK